MAWGFNVPLADLTQKLVDTRLRVERIRLGQRIQALEAQSEARGLPTKELRNLRKSLQYDPMPAPDRIDRALVLPSKPAGVWRKRYLAVTSKPGSVF